MACYFTQCRVATVRKKIRKTEVWEKSENCVSSQGNSKLYQKVSEKSRNFTFGLTLRGFLVSKGNVV